MEQSFETFHLSIFRTGSRINFKRRQDDVLADVVISGGNEVLAEALIIQAARHFLAASSPLPKKPSDMAEDDIFYFNINCFISEIMSMSANNF